MRERRAKAGVGGGVVQEGGGGAHDSAGPGSVPAVGLEVGVQLQPAPRQRLQVGGGQGGGLAHSAQDALQRGEEVVADGARRRRRVPARRPPNQV